MSSLLEYTIEKTKHGVRVMHNGKEVHKAKDTARAQQWLEDIVKEGVMGMPLKGHAYHAKSDEELRYIQQDAHQAADAMRDHNPTAEAKYLDQLNDAATILHYRSEGGKQQGKKMTENFMDATLAQNFIGAEIAFKQIMAEKAAQFMEQRKQEIAQTLAQESTVNESLRLLATHKSDDGRHTAKVYKDSEWNEHRVRFFTDGKHHENADHHTDDRADADGTAKLELKRMNDKSKSKD